MIKKIIVLALAFGIYTTSAIPALAHCPLCVAGAGVGLTLSRILGIDDSITGIWIGALLGAIAFWTQRLLGQKNQLFFKPVMGLVMYLVILMSTMWSFYRFNLVSQHGDILGYDKLAFGMIIGSAVFFMVDCANKILVKKDGHVFFPYQRVIVSLGSIVISSLAMYVLINYYI